MMPDTVAPLEQRVLPTVNSGRPLSGQRYLQSLLTTIQSHVVRFVDVAARSEDAEIRVKAPGNPGIHPVGIVEVRAPGRAWHTLGFAKADDPNYLGGQSLDTELYFLSEIAPKLAAENPDLRYASPIAYFEKPRLLLMEYMPGNSLKEHLFDFYLSRSQNLAHLLQLSGEWLGRLHALTQRSEEGNPLEFLIAQFEGTKVRRGLGESGLAAEHGEMLVHLRTLASKAPGFARRLCRVHGEFTPLHILVSGRSICVVDFATSTTGFAYDDFSLFTTFYEGLTPWRSATGTLRLPFARQKQLFSDSYFAHAPARFDAADEVIMRCMRVSSLVHLFAGRNPVNSSRGRSFAYRLARNQIRRALQEACADSISALQQTPVSAFAAPQR